MKPTDLLRYGLLAGVAYTADANRRHYRMATTWLPHLLTNALALLLPNLLGAIRRGRPERRGRSAPLAELGASGLSLAASLADTPRYVAYVAPLAAGYLLSHPQFNIYKGEWGQRRLAGFGFDAIPHAATAFGLTALVHDAAQEAPGHCPPGGALVGPARWCERRAGPLSALALALATAWWETGEYLIHRHELAQRGDAEAINMQWSLADTLGDCCSNAIGWTLAMAWRRRGTGSRAPVKKPA